MRLFHLITDIHSRPTGGGALLGHIDQAISQATWVPVKVAEDALICVALGARRAFEESVYQGELIAS